MKYIGELYGRIGKKYFPMEKRAEEIDAELTRAEELKAELKGKLSVSLDTLFEIKTFHGMQAISTIIEQALNEHVKTMKFPHPVSANNGDDIVYIHADGTQTWNTEKKDN